MTGLIVWFGTFPQKRKLQNLCLHVHFSLLQQAQSAANGGTLVNLETCSAGGGGAAVLPLQRKEEEFSHRMRKSLRKTGSSELEQS